MVRVDAREIYLKRILLLDRSTHMSFKELVNLALLITAKPGVELSQDQEKILLLLDEFLVLFETEKGPLPLAYILFQMEKMRINMRPFLKIKTENVNKKYRYEELLLILERLENEIMQIIREKVKDIRVQNPDVVL